MPDPKKIEEAILKVNDQASFIQKLLIDTLAWPIDEIAASVEDITFEWSADDLRAEGLDKNLIDGSILQLRPFPGNPWGIFILEFKNSEVFKTSRGMTSTLRRVLRGLVTSRRKAPHLTSFNRENLLFICSHQYKHYRFVHFQPPKSANAVPPLVYFGWGPDDPIRTVCEFNLKNLAWPEEGVKEDKWLKIWRHAFDVERVTSQFYEEYLNIFENAQNKIEESNELNAKDSFMFTQTLFNRLMFLRFTEKKGWLSFGGNKEYLSALYAAKGIGDESFYQSRLRPLFFKGLANKGSQRDDAYGSVVFLNGGLFEESDEDKKIPDLQDDFFMELIGDEGLFYRYNFTVEESTPLDIQVAIDPEMLGKVFEELIMHRQETGAYYTPRTIVSFMCKETLKGYLGGYADLVDEHVIDNITVSDAATILEKIELLKVVDPACGSGAYLLGMLHELHSLIRLLDTHARKLSHRDDYQRKLQIIQNNIYGVDIDPVAIQIARLRLWLSLIVDFGGDDPDPLPNLDYKIEEGNSLTSSDPGGGVRLDMFRQQQISRYDELKAEFQLSTTSHEKARLLDEINSLKSEISEYASPGSCASGFDWRVEFAEVFAREDSPGFDIVIANPPYGAKVNNALRDKYFPPQAGENQSKDLYGIFIARGLQILKPGGFFSFIISDTWRTIKSFLPLRKQLLNQTTISHVIDLPPWIFKATVNTGILTLQSTSPTEDNQIIAADLKNLEIGDWQRLGNNLNAISSRGVDVQALTYARYTYFQNLISSFYNYSFFIGSPRIYGLLNCETARPFGEVAEVKQGLATGDNEFYLRKSSDARGSYQIIEENQILRSLEITNLTDQEKLAGVNPERYSGRCFIPYDKGGSSDSNEGWLPNYNVPTQYYIDWSINSVQRLRSATVADVKRRKGKEDEINERDEIRLASRVQNSGYYFRDGITFSPTGVYAPTYRLLSPTPFDKEGSAIFSDSGSSTFLLGYLCSKLMRYINKQFINHTVHSMQGDICDLPFPNELDSVSDSIGTYVGSIISQQSENPRYPYHENEQKNIDELVYSLFDFSDEDIMEVELWFCRRYSILAKSQGAWDEIKIKYKDYLRNCDLILSMNANYLDSHPILQIIAEGESQKTEFKETLEADVITGEKHPGVLSGALKTITAFLNTDGGKLVVGISDKGEIKGLKPDFMFCQMGKKNKDGFELKLRDLIKSNITPIPLNLIAITFETLLEGDICIIDISPSKVESYLNGTEVFVRDGNRTIKLSVSEIVEWVKKRNS